MNGETNLLTLIQNMKPVLNDGQYVFCTIEPDKIISASEIVMMFKEKEAITLIVEKKVANNYDFIPDQSDNKQVYAWITLLIHSSLEAIGLTAAFSNALASEGISCNVVAAYYHDHIFVPYNSAQKAITVLENLSKGVYD